MGRQVPTRQKRGLIWNIDVPKSRTHTDTGVYGWGMRRKHSFSLGQYITIFLVKVYAIKACILENINNNYNKSIYILSDSRAALNTLNFVHINSKLFWDCVLPLMALVEHYRV
jgi:hypothetical protein